MNAKPIKLMLLLGCGLSFIVGIAQAQNVQGKSVKIETIKFESVNMPNEVRDNAAEKELNEPWYRVEVKFSTEEHAGDVSVRFYVEAVDDTFKIDEDEGGKKEKKYLVLTGEQTYLNVPRGREHYAAMFLDPMSLVRYGGKNGARAIKDKNVFVQITVGEDKASKSLRDDDDGWVDQCQQISGVLLGLKESPWWPSLARRYNRIKGL
ncbi:MAG: hypothetical protein LBK60_08325 [Verrucomicrobiales bacterium]|jgi:hypothetical protein|nr:hypothetical protein [Verrucomicrobiales bacterium]